MATPYSVRSYGGMIGDRVRMDAYVQALRQDVKPGSVVLDIGAGTGIFSLLAARLGARRVYAVEPDDSIEVARQTAANNGCADRIEFLQALSTWVKLPEKADVIVSDLRGVLPLFQHHIPSIGDARRRLLAPGGVMIPRKDTLWAAVVEAPDVYEHHVTPWNGNTYGLDMEAARRNLSNSWFKVQITPEQLLVEPRCWATLDYTTIENPHVSGEISWATARPGMAHGLCVWFETTLADEVGFSNAPGTPKLIYGSGFFPWSTPVAIAAGDWVSVALRADLVGDDYVWRWDSRVLDRRQPRQAKASFTQSTFFGAPLSPARLHKCSACHVPTLSEEGRLDQFILTLMDGQTTLEEVARRISVRFPECFPRWQDALTKVGALSERYSS